MKFIRPNAVKDTGAFSRAGTATFIGSNGLIQTAASGVARMNYNPLNLTVAPKLLLEAAATNLVVYSEQFDNAAWGKTNVTVTTGATAAFNAPDGMTTADKLVENGTSGLHWLSQFVTPAAGSVTYSVFAKAAENSVFALDIFSGTDGTATARFNLLTKSIGSIVDSFVGSVVPFIVDVGGGWLRCSVTVTTSNTSTRFGIFLADGASETLSYTGDGTSGIFIWGAQLEAGAFPTSYIPTVASTVTRSADLVTGTGLAYSTVPETDHAAWAAATSYTVGQKVIRTTTHRIYECLIAGVNATLPELATTGPTPRWLDVGPTNRWGMFDETVGTATTATTSMTVVLAPGRFNSLALIAVDAGTVTIDLNVSGSTVYTASLNLTDGNAVGDWYQYFYEPVYQQDAVVITDLVDASLLDIPAYGEGVLTVTLSKTSGAVSLGALIVGLYADLGDTQYQPNIGITDYSRKDTNAFGNTTIVKRAYSKRMSAQVLVQRANVDNVARVLAQYRSTPLVWVGAGSLYTSMIIYGFYKGWELTIENYAVSQLSLQVEGLT